MSPVRVSQSIPLSIFTHGDAVMSRSGHIWTVFLGVHGQQMTDAPNLPHVFILRQKGDELIYALLPTDQLIKQAYGAPFIVGESVFYEGDKMEVTKVTDSFVFLRDSDGRPTACWRWELALVGRLSRPLSILCCDMRQASDEEI
jgi:hypothetical protein